MQVRWCWCEGHVSSHTALPLQETLAPWLLHWTCVWGYLNLFLRDFICEFVYLSSCLVLFKLFTMYHVHVIALSQRIMLVTGISFIRMSYSFVSCSVIYLLFLNWHNVRFLFWITCNYMSECLNYPNLTTEFCGEECRAGCGGHWNKETSCSVDPRAWGARGRYLFCTNSSQCLCLKQWGCIQTGRETLGLTTSTLLCGLWLVFGQRYCSLTIWIYFALIFQCRHLIPAKSRAGRVTAFFCSYLAHQAIFVKVDWCVLYNF